MHARARAEAAEVARRADAAAAHDEAAQARNGAAARDTQAAAPGAERRAAAPRGPGPAGAAERQRLVVAHLQRGQQVAAACARGGGRSWNEAPQWRRALPVKHRTWA